MRKKQKNRYNILYISFTCYQYLKYTKKDNGTNINTGNLNFNILSGNEYCQEHTERIQFKSITNEETYIQYHDILRPLFHQQQKNCPQFLSNYFQ